MAMAKGKTAAGRKARYLSKRKAEGNAAELRRRHKMMLEVPVPDDSLQDKQAGSSKTKTTSKTAAQATPGLIR